MVSTAYYATRRLASVVSSPAQKLRTRLFEFSCDRLAAFRHFRNVSDLRSVFLTRPSVMLRWCNERMPGPDSKPMSVCGTREFAQRRWISSVYSEYATPLISVPLSGSRVMSNPGPASQRVHFDSIKRRDRRPCLFSHPSQSSKGDWKNATTKVRKHDPFFACSVP